MSTNLLEEIAKSHFESKSCKPLISSVYSKINDENLFEFFAILQLTFCLDKTKCIFPRKN